MILFARALLIEIAFQSSQIRDVRSTDAVIRHQMNFPELSASNLESRWVQEIYFVVRQVNVSQVGHRWENFTVESLDLVVFEVDSFDVDQIFKGIGLNGSDFVAIQIEIDEIVHVLEEVVLDDFESAVPGVHFPQVGELFTDVFREKLDLFVSAEVDLFNSGIKIGLDDKFFAIDVWADSASVEFTVQVNRVRLLEIARNFLHSFMEMIRMR